MAKKIAFMLLLFVFSLSLWAGGQGVASAQGGLEDVERWLYILDVNIDETMIAQIAASDYDMVVIDFITSEAANSDFPLAAVVATWQNADHPKLVIAYIDIGQAEAYRSYWQADWQIGDPEWILSEDPDGWAENYPVAYWYDEYQAIWLGEDGYLAQVMAAGFDGVYLDWVEAYDDAAVMAFADADGVDPVEEMVWWVQDIADTLRAINPDAIVIAQNASELVAIEDYVAVIDAIAQEQIWFDGGADNDPPGDCPLPRTEAEIDSQAYVDSLSEPCRAQWETYPGSTLHVSSEGYLEDLALAQAAGLVIFTVDYALEPENIAFVYTEARGRGFVPFVSNRGLDRYIEPMP